MHAWKPENPCCEVNYVKRLASLPCPIFMVNPQPELPTSVRFPKEEVLGWSWGTVRNLNGEERPAYFNPNDFASTLSWMLAYAIMQGPEEIGLWGVDMAANEEYGIQKDGCLSLIHLAKLLGIKITVPLQSDLLRPVPLYGYQEHDHFYIKQVERDKELAARINDARMRVMQAREEEIYLNGARDQITYDLRTWVSDPQAIETMFRQPHVMNNIASGAYIPEPDEGVCKAILEGKAEPGFSAPKKPARRLSQLRARSMRL